MKPRSGLFWAGVIVAAAGVHFVFGAVWLPLTIVCPPEAFCPSPLEVLKPQVPGLVLGVLLATVGALMALSERKRA